MLLPGKLVVAAALIVLKSNFSIYLSSKFCSQKEGFYKSCFMYGMHSFFSTSDSESQTNCDKADD